jgi:signal transduction histidine kinase
MKPDLVFGFENAGWPAVLTDRSGNIVRCNKAATQTFGPPMAPGAKLAGLWSPANTVTAEAFLDRWERQPAASSVLKLIARGITIPYTVVVCALQQEQDLYFILQFFPDIGGGIGGAESPPQDATLQKQKLEVAIKLARSVALDFKNALSGVLGHSSLLLMQAQPDHPWRKSLVEIEKAVAKGAEAAASLGSFSRAERERDPAAQGGSNLNLLLQHTADALGAAAADRSVQWEFQFERKLFAARFDEAKVQQAFTKILENAIEAMPRGGRVRISTRNLDLSQPTQDRAAKLAAGAYVCGEIMDTGTGIEPAILPRIFEPFFTTKSGGKHRGLGLPWVYGVITNLGGAVAVSSDHGSGTSVRVYLPADKQLLADTAHYVEEFKGTETILIVDDEEIIVGMGQTVLTAYGYKVLATSSAKKAVEMLARPEPKIDLLITDLVMPGMSGTELVEHAQKLRPSMPILMMSGALSGSEHSSRAYLPKPFTSQQLLEKVRTILRVKPERPPAT